MPTLALPTRQHRDPCGTRGTTEVELARRSSKVYPYHVPAPPGVFLPVHVQLSIPNIHDHDPAARWRDRLCASISSRRSFSSRWATWRTALVLDVAALEAEHRCLMSNQMWQRSSTLRLHITGMWLCRRSSQMHAARSITYNSAASDSMCWSVSQALFVLAMCTGQISSI